MSKKISIYLWRNFEDGKTQCAYVRNNGQTHFHAPSRKQAILIADLVNQSCVSPAAAEVRPFIGGAIGFVAWFNE